MNARPLDRRRFLVLVGGGVAYAALRPHLAWARHVSGEPPRLQPWTLPSHAPGNPLDCARALVGAAVLAPNRWNSQPWRFVVEGSSITLLADPPRALPVTDPDRRGMLMSLGAALENLLVAARAYGFRPTVTYFPDHGAGDAVARVDWAPGDVGRDRPLFAAIPERRTNRREFDGRGIYTQNRVQLMAQVPEGFHLHWLDDPDQLRKVSEVTEEAVKTRILDPQAEAEEFAWMRFGDDDARRRGDGVTVDALEVSGPAHWLARRCFNPRSWFIKWGAESASKHAGEAIRSSGALALLTTASTGRQQWLVGGQTYERLALKATQLGIAHQPINQPIDVARFRGEVLRRFGATGEEPLMMVRLGHAKQPSTSVRRGVDLVASFRNT